MWKHFEESGWFATMFGFLPGISSRLMEEKGEMNDRKVRCGSLEWYRPLALILCVMGLLGSPQGVVAQGKGDQVGRAEKELDRAREVYKQCLSRYREEIEACIGRVTPEVEKTDSRDLTRVFRAELEAFRKGGPPPSLVRTTRWEKSWGNRQRDLIAAEAALERGLVDAHKRAMGAGDKAQIKRLDQELKELRSAWILSGQPGAVMELLATSEGPKPPVWHYTTTDPGLTWSEPDYVGTGWREGLAGFGSSGMRGLTVRTLWTQERIWLRRFVDVPRRSPADVLILRLRFDEDAEIYVNGTLLMKAPGYNGSFTPYFLDANQKQLFHEGRNLIAVFCRNNSGGQAIDLGLMLYRGGSDVVASRATNPRNQDKFEVGAIWEGPRTHTDPVTPGETLIVTIEVLQRMGNQFLARVHYKGSRSENDTVAFGTVGRDEVTLEEQMGNGHSFRSTGKLTPKEWQYGFRGRGTQGAERYGSGEMKLTNPAAIAGP